MTLEQRVVRLEQAETVEAKVHVWAEGLETSEEAIARWFPDGVAEGASVVVFRWAAS